MICKTITNCTAVYYDPDLQSCKYTDVLELDFDIDFIPVRNQNIRIVCRQQCKDCFNLLYQTLYLCVILGPSRQPPPPPAAPQEPQCKSPGDNCVDIGTKFLGTDCESYLECNDVMILEKKTCTSSFLSTYYKFDYVKGSCQIQLPTDQKCSCP